MVLSETQIQLYNESLFLESAEASFAEKLKKSVQVALKGRRLEKLETDLDELAKYYNMPKGEINKNRNQILSLVRIIARWYAFNFSAAQVGAGIGIGQGLAIAATTGSAAIGIGAILSGTFIIVICGLLSKVLRTAMSNADIKDVHKAIDTHITELEKQKKKASNSDQKKINEFIKKLEKLKKENPIEV